MNTSQSQDLSGLKCGVPLENEQKPGYSSGVLSRGSKLLPCCTFIPGVDKQVISRARALLAALVGDGEEGCGGHGLSGCCRCSPLGPAGRHLVSVLRVLLLLCARAEAHGGRRECLGSCYRNVSNVCVLVTDFEIPLERHPGSTFPVVAEDSKKSETSLIGPHGRGDACVAVGTAIPVVIALPAAGHGAAEQNL